MTKKDIVKELIKGGYESSESVLMKKSRSELESLLSNNSQDDEDNKSEDVDDMELLREQMRKELTEEIKADLTKDETPTPTSDNKKKKLVDKDELIPVMNITGGGLVYRSYRSGAEWKFLKYGDTEYIEMQELMTMRSSQRKFLYEPWILIMDDNAVDHLGLDKMYKTMVKPDEIDSVFKMKPDEFQKVLDTAPRGIATLIVSRAKEKVEDKSLDSRQKIEAINKKFNLEL